MIRQLLQSPLFRHNYKKLHPNQKKIVDENIRLIICNPTIDIQKKQDLSDVFVHKFKVLDKQFLLAYQFDPKTLTLLMLGIHENFYRDLKLSLN